LVLIVPQKASGGKVGQSPQTWALFYLTPWPRFAWPAPHAERRTILRLACVCGHGEWLWKSPSAAGVWPWVQQSSAPAGGPVRWPGVRSTGWCAADFDAIALRHQPQSPWEPGTM